MNKSSLKTATPLRQALATFPAYPFRPYFLLAAALAHGTDLATALRWANVAGALTTTRFGPATCPSGAQIRALA